MTCAIGSHDGPIRFKMLGSGLDAEKLKRRLSCALGALGWLAQIRRQADAQYYRSGLGPVLAWTVGAAVSSGGVLVALLLRRWRN